MMEELRKVRREISKRLLGAEQREGSCLPELRRMEREARAWWKKDQAHRTRRKAK
ncbi:MAG TPA: hypothetical protein VKU80_08330 [Planctomycetota bacterium]|nr:hypothetical protein [Planctomycetota bacterium]